MYNLECPNCGKNRVLKSNDALRYAKNHKTWCRTCAVKYKYPNTKLGTAKRLLEESYESYYWLGLLAADGHFGINGRLKLTLTDYDTIDKFSKFIEMREFSTQYSKNINHKTTYTITLMDSDNILPLMEKYKIVSNKTYNPIDFSAIKGIKNKLSFIAGFIDGDGCIKNLHNRKDFALTIKVHKSWENILRQIGLTLHNNDKVYYYKDYVVLSIGDSVLLKKLKRIILNLNLPIMTRKWDIIDLNFMGKYEITKNRIKIVKKLLKENKSRKYIQSEINISKAGLSLLIKRNNLLTN